jgi:DNA-binding response OmpR family regulator
MPVRPRILIADNDVTNVQLLTDICATEDLDVMVAQDGDETLKAILEEPPDLVLLDVMMPNRDGFEVLQELRRNPSTRTLPVILVTAVSDDDSIRQGYQLGANDYLTKPFKVVELIARMRTLLGAAAYERVIKGGVNWEVGDHRGLTQVLKDAIGRDQDQPVALVLFQLLHLDEIEQRHDGATAVEVLHKLAARLRAQLRGVDSAFLLPPDLLAFVLIATDEGPAAAVAERLLGHLQLPIHLGEKTFDLDARWAITVASKEANPADLMQHCINRLSRPA